MAPITPAEVGHTHQRSAVHPCAWTPVWPAWKWLTQNHPPAWQRVLLGSDEPCYGSLTGNLGSIWQAFDAKIAGGLLSLKAVIRTEISLRCICLFQYPVYVDIIMDKRFSQFRPIRIGTLLVSNVCSAMETDRRDVRIYPHVDCLISIALLQDFSR